jgi:hypothetical protein
MLSQSIVATQIFSSSVKLIGSGKNYTINLLIFTEQNELVGLTLVQDVRNRTFPSSKFFTKIEDIRIIPYHS